MFGGQNLLNNYSLTGGVITSLIGSYLGINNDQITNLMITTMGGMALPKIYDNIKKYYNFSEISKLYDKKSFTISKKIGLNCYELKIINSSINFTKILSYLLTKHNNVLLMDTININYNEICDLANIKFYNRTITENYEYNNAIHSILFTLDKEENCIYIQSKTLDTNILKNYVKLILSKNTNSSSLNIYQPIIRRYDEKGRDIEDYKKYNSKKKIRSEISWNHTKTFTNKNLENTILSSQIKRDFLDDIRFFMNSEAYYNSKGIPYKRGYLLNGPPGTGKTSLIKGLANSYGMDVYIINMADVYTSDDIIGIFRGFDNNDNYHIICFEDIDRCEIFKSSNVEQSYNYYNNRYDNNTKQNNQLRTLLNELDGIIEGYKRITIFTSNDSSVIEKIDALCRPGRIDKKIEITYCDTQQLSEIYNHFSSSGEQLMINDLKVEITPANAIKIILSNTSMSPTEFMSEIYKGCNFNDLENIIDNAEKHKHKNKKRKLTNIEKDIPKLINLINNEKSRSDSIIEFYDEIKTKISLTNKNKFKKLLLGRKSNNTKIKKTIDTINKKIKLVK